MTFRLWLETVEMTLPRAKALLALPGGKILRADELLRAYRLAAKQYHPDTGGSQQAFVALTAARDYLKYYVDKVLPAEETPEPVTPTSAPETPSSPSWGVAQELFKDILSTLDELVSQFRKRKKDLDALAALKNRLVSYAGGFYDSAGLLMRLKNSLKELLAPPAYAALFHDHWAGLAHAALNLASLKDTNDCRTRLFKLYDAAVKQKH